MSVPGMNSSTSTPAGYARSAALSAADELLGLLASGCHRAVADALGRALVVGLDDHREGQPERRARPALEVAGGDQQPRGVSMPGSQDEQLGQPLVERHAWRTRPSRCRGSRAPRRAPGRTPRACARAVPSAVLKMRSGSIASRRATRCDAGPETSIFSTSCPAAASAAAMASTVSALSNSASSSSRGVGEPQVVRERDLHVVITT